MTARHGPAPDAVRADGSANGHRRDGANGSPGLFWEDWFRAATPVQRAEALDLARRQGVLYLPQLPAHGSRPSPLPVDGCAAALAALLAGKGDLTSAPAAGPVDVADTDLDDVQRLAVARALTTPDVCMIQGLPGTGKSRVVAEILTQAARRGERALFVAETTAPLDAVLERLVGRPELLPLRFPDTGEDPDRLPAWLRGFTPAEQSQTLLAQALAGAREGAARAEAACAERAGEEAVWPALEAAAAGADALLPKVESLRGRLAQVEGDVERETSAPAPSDRVVSSGPFAIEFLALLKGHQDARAALAADAARLAEERADREKEVADLDRQLRQLEPARQARQAARWWTAAYWKTVFAGPSASEVQALIDRKARSESGRREAEAGLAQVEVRRAEVDGQFQADRDAFVRGEVQRRGQELQGLLAGLEQELAAARGRCGDLMVKLPAELRPEAPTREAVARAAGRWRQRRDHDDEARALARQWVDDLEGGRVSLAGRLPELANLLVGTTAALPHDPVFQSALAGGCDMLVIERAERLTEAELLRLAGHARRVVLIGHRLAVPREIDRAPAGLPALAPACWPRLWRALGGPEAGAPCCWLREDERLVCRLVAVAPDERRYLETEVLADADDIELRILTLPKKRPCLAEVVFPADYPAAQAFERLARELGEPPLQPATQTAWWHDGPGDLTLHLGPPSLAASPVELEPGLRVCLAEDGPTGPCRAVRLEFCGSAGWDATRARAWLAARLPGAAAGRTVCLQAPYRHGPALAEALADVLYADEALPPEPAVDAGPAPEFVAVPPPRKAELPREGAGLELDLSAARHADRLPAELRGGLPPTGYVNYLEAQALVRRLEQLAESGALPAGRRGAPDVVVIALYEGQAELLRRLLGRCDALRPLAVEVGVPAALAEREWDTALVSLTRSHSHRSVTFGDDLLDLPLALTRARRQLLIFGDPGTLHKRAHWQGPLDHHPTAAARLEQDRLRRLLRQAELQAQPAAV